MSESTITPEKPTPQLTAYAHRACPSCGLDGAASNTPEVQSHPSGSSLSFEQLKSSWFGFFKDKAFFSYYRCKQCGTLYCQDYFTPQQLDQLYGQMPDNMSGVPLEALRKTQQGYFRFLQSHSSLRGDYMEVGPDIGLFTRFAVKEGHFDRFWLFEPNLAVRGRLEELLEGKPAQIFPEFLDVGKLPDHGISTVVMVHVLDHLTDPKALLLALRKKLAPGAALLFVTHDESSLLAKLTRQRWPPYCLQHPLLFNPRTITTLLQSTGFKVRAVNKSANYYPAAYLAKHAFWAAGLKKITFPELNTPILPLKLGNIMTVAQMD